MLRLAEIWLFLLPFAAYAAWRFLGPRLREPVAIGLLVGGILIAATMIWYGLERSIDDRKPYVPAQIRNGAIVK